MLTNEERARRNDERWKKEVVDGLARMHDVLRDISETLQHVQGELTRPPATPADPAADIPVLFSIPALSKALGLPRSAIEALVRATTGPVVTMVGERKYFHRDDVQHWLEQQRQPRNLTDHDRRTAWLPGRIGATVLTSSAQAKRAYCAGSNTEPLSKSKYSGRAVCRECRDDVIVNNDGRLRKHSPSYRFG
ncbi:hypothetical protein BH10ACT1_BH10ACT1_33510 [soil metagenome]